MEAQTGTLIGVSADQNFQIQNRVLNFRPGQGVLFTRKYGI